MHLGMLRAEDIYLRYSMLVYVSFLTNGTTYLYLLNNRTAVKSVVHCDRSRNVRESVSREPLRK